MRWFSFAVFGNEGFVFLDKADSQFIVHADGLALFIRVKNSS
jgi:hypothetical protein